MKQTGRGHDYNTTPRYYHFHQLATYVHAIYIAALIKYMQLHHCEMPHRVNGIKYAYQSQYTTLTDSTPGDSAIALLFRRWWRDALKARCDEDERADIIVMTRGILFDFCFNISGVATAPA